MAAGNHRIVRALLDDAERAVKEMFA